MTPRCTRLFCCFCLALSVRSSAHVAGASKSFAFQRAFIFTTNAGHSSSGQCRTTSAVGSAKPSGKCTRISRKFIPSLKLPVRASSTPGAICSSSMSVSRSVREPRARSRSTSEKPSSHSKYDKAEIFSVLDRHDAHEVRMQCAPIAVGFLLDLFKRRRFPVQNLDGHAHARRDVLSVECATRMRRVDILNEPVAIREQQASFRARVDTVCAAKRDCFKG